MYFDRNEAERRTIELKVMVSESDLTALKTFDEVVNGTAIDAWDMVGSANRDYMKGILMRMAEEVKKREQ